MENHSFLPLSLWSLVITEDASCHSSETESSKLLRKKRKIAQLEMAQHTLIKEALEGAREMPLEKGNVFAAD